LLFDWVLLENENQFNKNKFQATISEIGCEGKFKDYFLKSI
jgi:hypothetical protein